MNNMITDEDQYLSNINEVHPSDLSGAFKNKVLFNFSGQPMEEVLSWQEWMYDEVRKDIEKRQKRNVAQLSGNDYVKPGEYFEKAGGAFKSFLKIFIRKGYKQIDIFGRTFNFYYPLPARRDLKVKKSFLKKLTNKHLNGSSANLEALKIIKIDDNDVIKQLKMPLRRIAYKTLDGHGKPQEKKKFNGNNGSVSLLPVFMEEAGKYSVKRYESLRFVCDDIRKTSGKDVFAIEVGVLPQSDTGL